MIASRRTFVVAAVISGIAGVVCCVAIAFLWMVASSLGSFDAAVDDAPLTRGIEVDALLGTIVVLASRFWVEKRRNALGGALLGSGLGLIAVALAYAALSPHG